MDLPFRLPLLLDGPIDAPASHGLPPEIWAAEHPAALERSVCEFLGAGAQAVCAPTFGANRVCLSAAGLEDETANLNRRLLELTRSAAEGSGVPVGALIGPTGLFPPPLGDADFDDLFDVYREQIRALEKAGADFLLLERQASLADLRAALLAARTTDLPVLADLAVDRNGRTLSGGGFLPALITLQAMGADAVGLNGSLEGDTLIDAVQEAYPHAQVPLILRADAEAGQTPEAYAEAARALFGAGIRIAGGGLDTAPEHIRALSAVLKEFGPPQIPEEPDSYASAIEREAFFLEDDLTFSEPIACTSSLGDDLIDLDDERVSAALVEVTCVADAVLLGQHSAMTRLPIAVRADGLTVLDAALRYFQGRLIIDSSALEDRESAEPLAAKYGAIIY